MTLAPLLTAPWIIQMHASAALAALVLGGVQFLRRKGGAAHRILGWAWVGLMVVVAVSSFGIRSIEDGFSVIHLISLYTLAVLPIPILRARRGDVRAHRLMMISLFCTALAVTGAFTLLPGRIMGGVVFGW